jgi:pyruvate,water dikinase
MVPMMASVLSQRDTLTAPAGMVGAKASRLARIAGEGFPVPSFFVVPSRVFSDHLRDNGISWPTVVDDVDEGGWSSLRKQITASAIGAVVSREILEAYEELCGANRHGRVAVRSSGGEEDSASASFAGQFSSFLNLQGPAVLEAITACWASYISDRSMQYRAANGIALPPSPSFGVIIESQVFAQKAGIMFTVHPLDHDGDLGYVEANFGTGESVVGGLATPDAVVFDRSSGDVVETMRGTKRRMTTASLDTHGTQVVDLEEPQRRSPVLDEREVLEISRIGLRLEQLLGSPQDIEWAYDSEQLWILQARPITALATSR